MSKKLLIWDWNGTLLDDVEYSVQTINQILKKHNLNTISVQKYREKFCFPVKNYYKKIGFNFNITPFEEVGMEFINLYNKNLSQCKLQNQAITTFKKLKESKISQIIISARFNDALQKDIDYYDIKQYFDLVLGINNNYASSKEYLFEKFIKSTKYKNSDITLVGDTIHDCEIAKKFKINFLLFKKGHQSEHNFNNCNNLHTINCLNEVIEKII